MHSSRVVRQLAVVVVASVVGCSHDESKGTGPDAPHKRVIAVVPKGTTHEFWKSVHAGAEKAASELGVTVEWKGPAREDDRDQQVKVVEDFTTRGVAALVLAPLDDQALVAPCAAAKSRGLPVVVIDSGLKWPDQTSFVATDNRHGGSLGAERLGSLLGGKGKVLMLRYAEGSASTTEREAGFLETMKTKFPAIELVSTDQHGGATAETAMQAMENLLSRFAELDGVFTPNESTTFGSLRALDDAKRLGPSGRTKFVGFDATEALLAAMKAGKIQGLVVQNPFKMGELGVHAAVDALDGKPVDKRVDTGCVVVTPENQDAPDVSAALHPDLARWLK
jgi:ribose transport system substrate-binding protein